MVELAPPLGHGRLDGAGASGTRSRAAESPGKARDRGSWGMAILCACASAAIIWGWRNSSEGHITAESGVGYALGIVGSSMMMMLLLYPLRKRLRAMRGLGSVPFWFRAHMTMGVVGPTLVILHSNFSVGSINAAVALFSMLIVAASGFVGRFLYRRIHRGLYGHKLRVQELLSDAGTLKDLLGADVGGTPAVMKRLRDYEASRLRPYPGLAEGLWSAVVSGIGAGGERRRLHADVRRIVKQRAVDEGWTYRTRRRQLKAAKAHLSDYIDAVGRAAVFSLYERLFALWHVLHLPLFLLLIAAACAHVVAVHLY